MLAALEYRSSDADRTLASNLGEQIRLAQNHANLVSDGLGTRRRMFPLFAQALQQHDKLVAPDPGDGVGFEHQVAQPVGSFNL